MLYASKQFDTPFQAEEVVQVRSALEGAEKLSFTPKPGQSAADTAAEKRKIANVTREILAVL